MATPIIDHNLLTLDYWQDSVTYEGKTVPGGTIGCEALNIPDTLREKLAQAKSKLEKALQDSGYAQGGYAAEMEQAALLAEVKETIER